MSKKLTTSHFVPVQAGSPTDNVVFRASTQVFIHFLPSSRDHSCLTEYVLTSHLISCHKKDGVDSPSVRTTNHTITRASMCYYVW